MKSFLLKGVLPASLFVALLAEPIRAGCAKDSAIAIYYGNGMYISPARARVQALLMDRRIRPALPEGAAVTFAYSYNNSEEDVTQALQVLGQAMDDRSIRFQSWLSAPAKAPSQFRGVIRLAEQAERAGTYVDDADLAAHVARYKSDLAAGRRVIVLAHSQGNFYVNRAYEDLASPRGFAVIALGTPAASAAGGGAHVTLTNDAVVGPIPGRLPANTSNSPAFVKAAQDADGHSFNRSYLNGDVSGPRIVARVNALRASLACPEH